MTKQDSVEYWLQSYVQLFFYLTLKTGHFLPKIHAKNNIFRGTTLVVLKVDNLQPAPLAYREKGLITVGKLLNFCG